MQSKKKHKKVTLYFGSFNPVHNGHIGLANHVINSGLSDELWFVVSPQNPLKQQTDLLDENLRLEMLRLAIGSNLLLQVSDIEFFMPKPSYTVNTLQALQIKYPDVQFFLLIGSDNALVFNKWKDYTTILRTVKILVYPRTNFDSAHLKHTFPQMQLLKQAPIFDISSTQIRNDLENGNTALARQWLKPEVLNFITEHKLYAPLCS
ncbi:MAG: nicotinate-nucleotide adenylyltransferase [Prevotellaceae bacterium]|jgi:nicotinate-nucleotide adenylyltransferase|nr:nicotinate-nucleotide adenylyltransferase [Prevotellaceae bacterium]